MLDYMNAVRQAQSSGVKPVRYTISEGGNWISVEPFVKPTHVHAIEFDNGQRWDELNGWNFIGRSAHTQFIQGMPLQQLSPNQIAPLRNGNVIC